MSSKILITGGAGFIGLHLANRLLDDGYTVFLADNLSRSVNDIDFQNLLNRKHIEFINMDLLDSDSFKKLDRNFDYIFHLAAIIGVQHVLKKPYRVLYDNIDMLNNIIDFTHQQKKDARLFFASTSEIYAGTLKHFDLKIPTPEDSPLALTDLSHPRTSYMLSKIFGEALCKQSGLPFTIFRPHNIYGPRMGMSHIIPEQLNKAFQAKNSDKVEVFSVNHTRCFCYIDDAIEMLVRMMRNPECSGKVLNLGTQNPEVTMRDVAKTCFSVANKSLIIQEKPASPGSPERRVPNMDLTKKLTNFSSKVDLHNGISQTYKWYKKYIFEGGNISAL